jgi:hypothetical protein
VKLEILVWPLAVLALTHFHKAEDK